jgi:hypothetical protein
MQTFLRTTLLVLACAATPLVFAQWQWVDKDGRKVFSDQAPPPEVPANKILKRPGGGGPGDAEPQAPAASQAAAASMPRVSGKDKELEEKKKLAAAAGADKKRAQEEENARLRAENCARAKRGKATLDSGVRLVTVNGKGENEVMGDEQRAAEQKRVDAAIAQDCQG